MTGPQWAAYALLNLSAASAIALDACLMIILRFRSLRSLSAAMLWAGAVGVTHIAFPMIGFAGGWWLIRRFHVDLWVYGAGAILLVILLVHVMKEATHLDTGHGPPLDIRIGSLRGFWVPVFVVSLDALFSGPGKVVMVEHYEPRSAIASFVIVGLLVALFTSVAGYVAWNLRVRMKQTGTVPEQRLIALAMSGVFLEIALFAFFLFWTVGKGLEVAVRGHDWLSSWRLAVPLALTLALILFWPRRLEILKAQRATVLANTGTAQLNLEDRGGH